MIYIAILLIVLFFYKENKLFTSIFVLILILLSIFRSETVGTDYSNYISTFKDFHKEFLHYDWKNILSYFISLDPENSIKKQTEPLWVFLNFLTYERGLSYYFVNFISVMLILSANVWAFARKSTLPAFSLVLFYALFYYFVSFNTIRQSISLAFVLIAFTFISEKRIGHISFFLVIAILFHFSAFFAFFALIALFLKINLRTSYFLLFGSLVFGSFISEFIINILNYNPIYYNYANVKWDSTGIFISSVNYSIQSFLFYFVTSLKKDNFQKDIFTRIWLMGLILQNIFISFIFFHRIADYFLVAQLIAIPFYLQKPEIVNERINKNVFFLYIIILLLFMFNIYFNKQGIVPYELIDF